MSATPCCGPAANNSFKPNLLRYTKATAEKACHGCGSTTQVGLTQALGPMLKFLAIWLFLAPAPAAGVEHLDENEVAIREKMLSAVGADAEQCGSVPGGAPLEAAWNCAQQADREGRAFWLAIEGHRTDSAIWHIITRDPSGKRSVFFYTSNNWGQPTFEPHFTLTECREPFELFEQSQFMLRCGPDVP